MEQTYFEKYNSQAVELFKEIKTVLQESGDDDMMAKTASIPTSLYGNDKQVNVVFAGQYGAGKSSLLTILTGKKLEVGGGITTNKCQSFEWQGVNVTDTPGIHTQNRPDHDEITYEQLSKADLVVFVITNEGFSEHLAKHFRKLINDKGKGHEMMLVVNKMDRTADGNTPEQQAVLIDKDILPVIDPYSAEDLYTSFISTEYYNEAIDPQKAKYKEWLEAKSGMSGFIDNLNKFIADKRLLGASTTSLYEAEKILSDIVSNIKTGDVIVDGSIHILNEQRRMLEDAKYRIKDKVQSAINDNSNQIQKWGNEVAGQLRSIQNQAEVNRSLTEKASAVDKSTEKLTADIENILNIESGKLQNALDDFSETEFARDFKMAMNERLRQVNISAKTRKQAETAGNFMKNAGEMVTKMTAGPKASPNFSFYSNLEEYTDSIMHKVVINVAHKFKFKFKPWQAVRWTKNIANGARVLSIADFVISVGLQIYNGAQEDKMELQLQEGRSEIRSCFSDAANVVELEYDKETNSWIEQNIDVHIRKIDKEIEAINNAVKSNNELYDMLSDLLRRVRNLISEIQAA